MSLHRHSTLKQHFDEDELFANHLTTKLFVIDGEVALKIVFPS